MHWSESLAQQVIERNPGKEEYVCATGISPSGSIHLGNFRDIATGYFVVRALRKLGKKARLIHSWDDFDRLRKIPSNVAAAASGMEKYIGYPLCDVPNPFPGENGAPSYAAYFEREFGESLEALGIEPDYKYQAEMYRSGAYTDKILLALKERGRIFDILDSFRTQDAEEGERDGYYPVAIYCPACKRDTTTILDYDDGAHTAQYECKCGHRDAFDFNTNFNCKLAWKVDWAMRWGYEGVDFEPGGPDHASPSGSFQTSRILAKEIYGVDAPHFQSYSFIGLKGATGKMSGSTGLNLTPKTLLKIYEPEVMLWLYSRTDPMHSFDFCFDDGILRQYTEFDRMYANVANGAATDVEQAIMYNCTINNRTLNTVSMTWLVQFGSVVNFSPGVLEAVFTKIGTPYKAEEFIGRLKLAKNWLEMCSPGSVNRLNAHRNWPAYDAMNEEERKEISVLHDNLLNNEYSLDDLNTMIYAVPAQVFGEFNDAKQRKTMQAAFFKNVYKLLIGKEQGPRLYLFLYALDRGEYMHLLDFSTPKTGAEGAAGAEGVADAVEATEAGNAGAASTADIAGAAGAELTAGGQAPVNAEGAADNAGAANAADSSGNTVTVKPIKPTVQFDDFAKLDMRVCEILKCEEIRKSHNCYKLTLDDGLGGRVIVSSIKNDYTPEQLIGKKIIVLVNLAHTKITGVTSEGMLLATTSDDGKCTLIFADGQVLNGSSLH